MSRKARVRPAFHARRRKARDLRLRREMDGCCRHCGLDPYHRVHNGIGYEAVAIVCCDKAVEDWNVSMRKFRAQPNVGIDFP